MTFALTKARLIGFLGLLLVAPWLAGGKDNLALILNFFVLGLILFLIWRSEHIKLTGWLPWVLLALMGWGAGSLFWSVNRFQTVSWLVQIYGLIGAFVLGRYLQQTKRIQQWLRGYVWGAAVAGVYGTFLLVTAEYNRLTSTFYWANPMAGWLLPAVFLSYFWWAETGRRTDGMLAVITGSSLLLTYSRGALGVAALIGVVGVIASRRSMQFWVRFILAAFFVTSLSIFIPHLRQSGGEKSTGTSAISQQSRFIEAAQGESNSIKDRLNYLDGTMKIWQRSPLIGSGAGTWATLYPAYQSSVTSAATNAHNWFAQLAAELGIVGFVLLLGIALVMVRSAYIQMRDPALLPVVLGLVALLAHSAIDIDAGYPAILALLGVLMGILYRSRDHIRLPSPIPLLIALLLALPVIAMYQSQVWRERGRIEQDNHDYAKAAEDFDLAAKGIVYNPDVQTAKGINYYTLGAMGIEREENAIKAMQAAMLAMAADEHDSQHYFLMARANVLYQTYDLAEANYRKALARDHLNHPEYYVDLARLYIFQQRWAEAGAELDTVIGLYPQAVIDNRHLDETVAPELETAKALRARIGAQ